jgi:hypothetical protein
MRRTQTNSGNRVMIDQISSLAVQPVDIAAGESGVCDAFSRLRVSTPESVFDSASLTIKQGDRWTEKVTGDGAVSYTSGFAWVELSSAASGTIIRQTRRYFPYQPAKSFLIFITGTLQTSLPQVSGQTARIGIYDDNDGFFFELQDNVLCACRRSSVTGSVVDTKIPSSSFSHDDASWIRPNKRQIFVFEQEWLGVGTMTMSLVTSDRKLKPIHRFNHANDNDSRPYTNRATLPVRYEVINTSGSPMTLNQICTAVISEGGYSPSGRVFSHAINVTRAVSAEEPVLAIRSSSARSRVTLNPTHIALLVKTGGAPMLWRLYKFHAPVNAAVLPGATWTATNASTESAAEIDSDATGISVASSQHELSASGFFSDATDTTVAGVGGLMLSGSDVDGNSDWIVVTVEKIDGGSTERVTCSLTWQELE